MNDEDTIIVDSHVTPVAARALLASVAELTDKPVRYLVNTHYHFDHAHGNFGFPPGVDIVGHLPAICCCLFPPTPAMATSTSG